jgi:transcriptional regulator with XRE-family HTH domain
MISPYVRRMRLAAELRELRRQAGLTHEQLAREIGQSRAQISRVENGHGVDQADIFRILDALKVDGERWTQIVSIAREAGERGWWESDPAMGKRQALSANLEAGAKTIRQYEMIFIPGLLQTLDFTRARAEAEALSGSVNYRLESVVEARQQRQRMLHRPGGPTYEVIIDEFAIRRLAAPCEVVREQLYHLTARANLDPNTTMRVLPIDADIRGHNVPRSAFSIYTYPDPGDPTVVSVDTVTEDLILTQPTPVKRYEDLYDRLSEAALSVRDGLDFLIEQAKGTTLPPT